jgi:hypothetical protein
VTYDLFFRHFLARRRWNIASGSQLAFLLLRMRDAGSTRQFVEIILNDEKDIKTADAAVEFAMDLQRNWAGFRVPRYLRAIDRIQREVFGQLGLAAGDYTVHASDLEHLFMAYELVKLDEYGLPLEVGAKLGSRIALGQGLDAAIASFRQIVPADIALTPFERDLVVRSQAGLGAENTVSL